MGGGLLFSSVGKSKQGTQKSLFHEASPNLQALVCQVKPSKSTVGHQKDKPIRPYNKIQKKSQVLPAEQ